MTSRVLVTGGAGFIGSHLVDALLADGFAVLVVDNFDPFYARELKERNIAGYCPSDRCRLIEADIRDREQMLEIFRDWQPEVVVHLAAKAGVRPSVDNPPPYVEVNVVGTANLLDASVQVGVKKFIFGSSSSVYGLNEQVPFSEQDQILGPASPYAATKVAGEALCKSYSNCYRLPVVALRFFTVYGPRQRPDLAIYKFAGKILRGEPITLYGDGSSSRDYTYVSDIVNGIRRAMDYAAAGYEVFNLGNAHPVKLLDLVRALEEVLGSKAQLEWLPVQAGDVPVTWADLQKSGQHLGYRPQVSLKQGLALFAEWLREWVPI